VNLTELGEALHPADVGQQMFQLMADLYPICRSITGEGMRQTLYRIRQEIPLELFEVPSGTQVLDWTVPDEWNIRDAYIKNAEGERIVDFRDSNLHVVSYSVPFQGKIGFQELRDHLFTLPDRPDWIPYRTSYYKSNWGFCLSHRQLLQMKKDAEYEVCIDSALAPGSLTYGELRVPGETSDEILVSCHSCHPSLCNDNLSGIALATFLAKHIQGMRTRYTYRFLFIPGTIGSITWLAQNRDTVTRIKHGLVVTCVGDPGRLTYKRSRQGNAEIDRAVQHVLRETASDYEICDFFPYGYDERQYCSPGFNLAVGSLTRTPHGRYPEYHTSADNLDFVRPECLVDTLEKYLLVLDLLEKNRRYRNLKPHGEPQLGKRGLYRPVGGQVDQRSREMALLWVLNFSDGEHSLLDIAERANMGFREIREAAKALVDCGLLEECREYAQGAVSAHRDAQNGNHR
jgi:aminopeptidase-like protein